MMNEQKKTIRSMNLYLSIKRATMAGWLIPLSSDGYSTYGIGNHLANDNYGKNGFGNPNAWCVLSNTINNQQYQFCLQTDGYMGLRIKYSKLGFSIDTDNLRESPYAMDEEILVGSGTNMAPIYQKIVFGRFIFFNNRVFISLTTTIPNTLNFALQPPLPSPIKPIIIPSINNILK
jgi:hypothetical protein